MSETIEVLNAAVQTARDGLALALANRAIHLKRNAPLRVGEVIEYEGNEYQIAVVCITEWDDKARYEVRKRTSSGWHRTIMRIGGLSTAIQKGRYTKLAASPAPEKEDK